MTAGDTATLTFSIIVEANRVPAFATGEMVDAQTFVQNRMLSLTLPAVATPGNGETTYTLTPAIAGLTLDPFTRVLSGAPTTTAAAADYTYTAADEDTNIAPGDAATLIFSITVRRENPTGITLSVDPAAVTESSLATDISLTATFVGGTFGADRRVTFESGGGTATPGTDYTVVPPTNLTIPANMASASVTISFTAGVDADAEPSGETVLIGGELLNTEGAVEPSFPVTPATITINDYIPVTVSAGPDQTVAPGATVELAGAVTAGPASRLSTMRWFFDIADEAGISLFEAAGLARGDAVTEYLRIRARLADIETPTGTFTAPAMDLGLTSAVALPLAFTVSDLNAPAGQPSQAIDGVIITVKPLVVSLGADQTVAPGDTVTITAAVTGNNSPAASLTTMWSVPALSQGIIAAAVPADASRLIGAILAGTGLTLTFTATAEELLTAPLTFPVQLTVTDPTAAVGQGPVTDEVSITVFDAFPIFANDASIGEQSYIVGQAITPLTLPLAIDGDGALTYTLAPAIAGLTLDPTSRVLSGTPLTAAAVTEYTYTVTDEDSDTDTLTFRVTVRTPATGFTLILENLLGGGFVTGVNEGGAASILLVVRPTPDGGVFAADQMVTLTATPPPPRPANAADPYVPYTAITPVTLAFPAHTPREASTSITLMARNDLFDHADFPVTFTATASPSGITGTATVTLLDDDISITTTTASATVAAGATATYDVQLSEQPPTAIAVTVASQGTATATVSPATLTFTTGNWNTAQPVTVTGVAMGSTTIRHSAPTASDFSYVTNDVAVTVTAPAVAAPVFTNAAAFATPIDVEENQSAVRGTDYFGASDTSTGNLVLSGADMSFFTLSPTGTLTFNAMPNFEMPRGMAFNAGSNTNNYALTVAATNSTDTTTVNFTVRVTDVNDLPVLDAFTLPTFTEYTTGTTITFTATDEDRPAQTLVYTLAGATHDAAITAGGMFTWTPREADGRVARTFTVRVTDGIGTPPMNVDTEFTITADELPNRPPTGASITIAGGATMVTNPSTLGVSATASDPDTGDTLTYTWSSNATGDSFSSATGASVTWTPPTVMAAAVVVLTVTVTDSTDGSVTATQNVTVNPMPVAPVFTNMADFATPIEVEENQTAVRAAGYFAATGTGAVTYTLSSTSDASGFSISDTGTLTFDNPPNFEFGRGGPGFNSNDYTFTITATASGLSTQVSITVRVTDVNERPVLPSTITSGTFTEYSTGTITLSATDVDAGQTLTFSLVAPNHGATVTGNTFRWTPGEDDGGEMRMFTVRVTDNGTPPMSATRAFNITAMELPNRAPTGATLTVAGSATMVTNPGTLGVSAAATDPDTGDTLTYTWSSSATGGSFSPATGAGTTWMPPIVTSATVVTLTVTITDTTDGSVTATQNVTVNPLPVAPVFTNMAMFTTPISVAENTTAVGAAGFFIATGAVSYSLTGADMSRFTLSTAGTLTFNDAPDFENPRGMPLSTGNTNTYTIGITARSSAGLIAQAGTITIQVTDVNEAPVFPGFAPPTFTEYSTGTITLGATDVDAGQTLTYRVNAPTHGATITGNTFTWTPGEDDGDVLRTFSLTVTDSGTPPMSATRGVNITAAELPNRAPTGATITGATMVTSPNTLSLVASATDPDTGTTLTYDWDPDEGSVSPFNAASATYMPRVLTAGDAAITVVIRVTVSDGTLSTTATHTITVNPPVPTGTAPAFTNAAMFSTAIEAAENQSAAGAADFFVAPGTGTVTLTLGGADATRFSITAGGTLTFRNPPNFERPRSMAFNAGTNSNDYALTVTAMNAFGSAMSGVTVRVTDANDAPVFNSFVPPAFTEYSPGTLTLGATDVDRPAQTLTYTFLGDTHGATISGNTFSWTPGEDDGDVLRIFTVRVIDDGTPSMRATRAFNITAVELANRAPINATLTVAGGATSVTNPSTLGLTASATDPDTGDMLTYSWSSDATGDSFSPTTGASVTWTPPTVTSATVVTLTVTVTDSTDGSVTATQNVTVNPMPVAPVFTNAAMFSETIFVEENTTAVGTDGFFVATGTGTVAYTLGGADADRFTISDSGTLTFSDAPDFEMPRGMAFDADSNTTNYALTVTAMNSAGTTPSGDITVRVYDANDAPTDAAITTAGDVTTVTNPATLVLSATATDPDIGTPLTYTWSSSATGDSFSDGGIGDSVTWTPPTVMTATTVTLTVTVSDDDTMPLTTTATQMVTVNPVADTAPAFAVASLNAQTFTVGTAITAITLPVATGGEGIIAYTLTPALPAGLTYTANCPHHHRQSERHLDGDDVHLDGRRRGRQHCGQRHRHADLQHHGGSDTGDARRPDLHQRGDVRCDHFCG